jgi:hypothetical protein
MKTTREQGLVLAVGPVLIEILAAHQGMMDASDVDVAVPRRCASLSKAVAHAPASLWAKNWVNLPC